MKISTLGFFAAFVMLLSFHSQAQSSADEQIKETIELFFTGMKKADTTLIRAQLFSNCQLSTVTKNENGDGKIDQLPISRFLTSIASKPSDLVYDERISSYDIQIDQNMAIAWTPYRFYLNDNFSHCGVNVFSLIQDKGKWKVFNICDTRTKSNCD